MVPISTPRPNPPWADPASDYGQSARVRQGSVDFGHDPATSRPASGKVHKEGADARQRRPRMHEDNHATPILPALPPQRPVRRNPRR